MTQNNPFYEYSGSWQESLQSTLPRLSGKKKLSLQRALDLFQNLLSEISDALTDDSSDDQVPSNNLLEFSLDSEEDD
ncbi:hypothetical protein TNCV_5012341 [Trichonephila clavipes]|nr:hypothetical protein TNCV_5012341 [Trichonephila clavipes]